jgi:HEAT repeat protein
MAMLARSNDIYIRRAAFDALRGFKDRSSFPILVEALDDQDQYIRYDAMFTLCLAMNAPDFPCPAVPLFESDEQKYINRIRAWWTSQQ